MADNGDIYLDSYSGFSVGPQHATRTVLHRVTTAESDDGTRVATDRVPPRHPGPGGSRTYFFRLLSKGSRGEAARRTGAIELGF